MSESVQMAIITGFFSLGSMALGILAGWLKAREAAQVAKEAAMAARDAAAAAEKVRSLLAKEVKP